MKDAILLIVVVAIMLCGFFVMKRLDEFVDKSRKQRKIEKNKDEYDNDSFNQTTINEGKAEKKEHSKVNKDKTERQRFGNDR